MKPLAELDHLNLDPAAKTPVAAVIQALLDRVERDALTIQAKDFKIEALTLELAHIRRIRYGVKSETLSPLQRDVFEETWTPTCPPLRQKSSNWQTTSLALRSPSPNAHVPDVNPYRIICRVSNPVLSLSKGPPRTGVCTCGQCGKELVKIGEDVTEQLDVEPAKFFVPNTLAELVKPSRQRRFRR